MSEPAQEETFVEQSAIARGVNAAAMSAGAGLLISAVQNSLSSHNHGAAGIFTRTGTTIALFTAMGGAFSFTDAAVANARQKNDPYNGAAGGCAAGLVAGAQARSLPMMAGACLGMAALVGTFDAAGKSLTGNSALPTSVNSALALQSQRSAAGEGESHAPLLDQRAERERRRQAFFKKKGDVEQE